MDTIPGRSDFSKCCECASVPSTRHGELVRFSYAIHVYKSNQVPENKQPFLPTLSRTYLIRPCLYLTTHSMKSLDHRQTRRQSSLNSGCQERLKPSVSAWLSMLISRQSVKHEERNVSLDSYCSVRASLVSTILSLFATFSVEQDIGKSTTLRRKRTTFSRTLRCLQCDHQNFNDSIRQQLFEKRGFYGAPSSNSTSSAPYELYLKHFLVRHRPTHPRNYVHKVHLEFDHQTHP